MTTTQRHRIATSRHSIFVERAATTYRAYSAIDKRYPAAKFLDDNAYYTGEVRRILNDETLSGQGAIDALLKLIGEVTSK